MTTMRFLLVALALVLCVGAAESGCNWGESEQGGEPESKASLDNPPTGYLKCNPDSIASVPDFLDQFHRFRKAFCKEVEKAEIPRECPRAKQEWDRLANAYTAKYVTSLSEKDLDSFIFQTSAALEYLPKNPEICSLEWREKHGVP